MTKAELLRIIDKLREPDSDLGFLLELKAADLKTLTGCIGERVENADEGR
jgi:hypothetical protein